MKKITTFLAAAALLTAGVATAGLELDGVKTDIGRFAPRSMTKAQVLPSKADGLTTARTGAISMSAPAREATSEGWTAIGTGTYREAILSDVFRNVENTEIPVAIEQNVDDPNTYRVVNPYANWQNPFSDVTYSDDPANYIVFHVINDQYAYIEDFSTGLSCDLDGDGTIDEIKVASQASSLIQGNGIDLVMQVVPECLATYSDGVLKQSATFSLQGQENSSLLMYFNDEGYYRANSSGQFAIALPGKEIVDEPEPQINWTSLGTGSFTDDFLTLFNGVEPQTMEVEILQDADDPTHYMIPEPYATSDYVTASGGEFEFYVVDNSYVYFTKMNTGFSNAGNNIAPQMNLASMIKDYGAEAVYAQYPDAFPKFENGTISCTSNKFSVGDKEYYVFLIPYAGSSYAGNANNAFRIEFPEQAPQFNWVDLGTGKFTDDFLASYIDGVEPSTFDVTIQQDADDANHYRILNPYANWQNATYTAQGGEAQFYVYNNSYAYFTYFNTGVKYNGRTIEVKQNVMGPINSGMALDDIISLFPEALVKYDNGAMTATATFDNGGTPFSVFQIPEPAEKGDDKLIRVNLSEAFRLEMPGYTGSQSVNPFAPTGQEVVKGTLQTLYHPTKDKVNVLTGAEQLGEGADGWSIKCGNDAKNLEQAGSITINGTAYPTIKLSNGAQNIVTLPEGYVANAVYIYSVINFDASAKEPRPCYFKEVDGETYTSETSYLTSFKDFENYDVSYFTLKGNNTFTFTNTGEQALVVLVVDYSEAPKSPFGDAALQAPENVWPRNNSKMLPLSGKIMLTYAPETEVGVFGEATVGDKSCTLAVENNIVSIAYEALQPATEYTVVIPAKAIGNAEASNEEITYTFTTEPADVLFYSDFGQLPYDYYNAYGRSSGNVDIIAPNSTDVTAEIAAMTFYSGTKGRAVAMGGANNSADPAEDYGPFSTEDAGASNRAVQLIGGGNGLYLESPEFEGPAEVTFYLGNPDAAEATVILTDERGKDYTLTEFTMQPSKSVFKFTYTYPYKGTAKLRLYNQKVKLNVNDILIVKGEGEGIDRPVIVDETAPEVVSVWPSEAPYAPVEGTVTVLYTEPVATQGKALLNGSELDVTIDGNKLSVPYTGLEAGKEYKITIPAVKDEAGNETPAAEFAINTIADHVYYYTDFGKFPYDFYTAFCHVPNEAADNEDIIAKNSTDVTVEKAGITYYSGTKGRVVAMGKPNLLETGEAGASERCIQIIGGGNGLYLELPQVPGAAELTIFVGNSATKQGNLLLTDEKGDTENPLAAFTLTPEKSMFKFTYKHTAAEPLTLRLYNMGIQCNIHDIQLVKGTESAITGIEAGSEVEPVYYNLQGVRVENPKAGLYIRVRGNVTDKVVIR